MNEIVAVYEDSEHDYRRETEKALEGAAEEIGAALRLTRRTAGMEAALALEMNRKLPSVHNALLRGEIDHHRAKVLVDSTLHVHPDTARKVVDTILPEAGHLTTGQLRSRIAKLRIDENPADALNRYEWDLDDRRVVVEANPSRREAPMDLSVSPWRPVHLCERGESL